MGIVVPDRVLERIKAEFPDVATVEHEGYYTSGFAVEIQRNGEPWRNGWHIRKDDDEYKTDWEEFENSVLDWLRKNPSG